MITVSRPTFCCVGVGLWLRLGLGCDNSVINNKKIVNQDEITARPRRVPHLKKDVALEDDVQKQGCAFPAQPQFLMT